MEAVVGSGRVQRRWCEYLDLHCAAFAHILPPLSTNRFANRETRDFITPAQVEVLEEWSGKAVCQALITVHIPLEVRREVFGIFMKCNHLTRMHAFTEPSRRRCMVCKVA
jgi:hypothetical protein